MHLKFKKLFFQTKSIIFYLNYISEFYKKAKIRFIF
jgi:hypothetical protein